MAYSPWAGSKVFPGSESDAGEEAALSWLTAEDSCARRHELVDIGMPLPLLEADEKLKSTLEGTA